MKNRSWLPLSLDIVGLIALTCAAFSLIAALYLAATAAEAQLLQAFKDSMMTAVVALLIARITEISGLLQSAVAPQSEVIATPNNVETLPERDSLPRAA